MYVVPKHVSQFVLLRSKTILGAFSSLEAIGRHLGIGVVRGLFYSEISVDSNLSWYEALIGKPPHRSTQVVGPAGEVISWKTVYKACQALIKVSPRDRSHPWNGEGPVPGISRSRGSRFKRRPRTSQELRLANGVVFEDGEPEWRARRKDLPTVFDDLILHHNHNWKRHRRTQWK